MGKIDILLKDSVGFIDYIPRLRCLNHFNSRFYLSYYANYGRILGEACLSAHLDEQHNALSKLLGRINLSVNRESKKGNDEDSGENDVAAAAALVRHVDRLRGQWHVSCYYFAGLCFANNVGVRRIFCKILCT